MQVSNLATKFTGRVTDKVSEPFAKRIVRESVWGSGPHSSANENKRRYAV